MNGAKRKPGRPQTMNGFLAQRSEVHIKKIRTLGGAERLVLMSPEARKFMLGIARRSNRGNLSGKVLACNPKGESMDGIQEEVK